LRARFEEAIVQAAGRGNPEGKLRRTALRAGHEEIVQPAANIPHKEAIILNLPSPFPRPAEQSPHVLLSRLSSSICLLGFHARLLEQSPPQIVLSSQAVLVNLPSNFPRPAA
jgi:hypothetical protein